MRESRQSVWNKQMTEEIKKHNLRGARRRY